MDMVGVRLARRRFCSGCAACHDACARGAISMAEDREGFLYPRVDASKCIGCGRCREVCPALNRGMPRRPMRTFAIKASDDVRSRSSSGGVFPLLAGQVLASGGVVFGACFDSSFDVVHAAAATQGEVDRCRGSKYVQSRADGIYSKVLLALRQGRRVLFSGTPCQAAGLRRFLGHGYDGLLVVELICHGAPSRAAWRAYLKARADENRSKGGDGLVRAVEFRDKSVKSERGFTMSIVFGGGVAYSSNRDLFNIAFGCELFNRPSCHRCGQRSLRSGADLVIGDYHGLGDSHPEFFDKNGVSAVLACTEKGLSAVEGIKPFCRWMETSYEDVLRINTGLERDFPQSDRREEFMERYRDEGFDSLVTELLYTKQPRLLRWRNKMRKAFGLK